VIEPGSDRSLASLCDYLRATSPWVRERLIEHGALLLRGFDVDDAHDFERVARSIDDGLKNEYLGTSPRNGLTDYVFTASELPPFYPIPQHCEMSFTANPPRRLFFCCLLEPDAGGGETPLVDFREVYKQLDPAVLARFEKGGIRIVRNYAGPESASKLDLWKLKRWDEMFATTDRAAVEAKCREEGFEPTWSPNGSLRLTSTQPVLRRHPDSGEAVWPQPQPGVSPVGRAGRIPAHLRAAPDTTTLGFVALRATDGRGTAPHACRRRAVDALHVPRTAARSPTPTWRRCATPFGVTSSSFHGSAAM